ncbi:MAG: NAD-dependent epimerase/dehydratase family protein [Chlorobi bacterium]|nr:NAD-dependent epimerase/dehydratase family protein [Chlorobiota bacterium]
MSVPTILITGAGGEMGHALIKALSNAGVEIVASDLRPLAPELAQRCAVVLHGSHGDVTNPAFIEAVSQYPIERIFHLAAVLSTAAERDPVRAHRINVDGTLNVLELAQQLGCTYQQHVRVIFPSTIAVYGFESLDAKLHCRKVGENDALQPQTLYGIAKLHCERLGIYYNSHYKKLSGEKHWVDFRSLRFPGLISADTLPAGGTSDYAPEMLHAAARGEQYVCFVRPDTQIPFMAMPDGVRALLQLADAAPEQLSRRVYNIGAFAPTAAEIAQMIQRYFPDAAIEFEPDPQRQAIVDSWCADVNDSAARRDWGWQPLYDFEYAFADYLVPAVRRRYATIEATDRH